MHIFADPQDADTVYVMDVDAYRSTDGGRTFNKFKLPHGDNHGLWIDPKNPERMIDGNDGGVTVTLDGGKTWSPPGQSAHRAVLSRDRRQPYALLHLRRAAGQQHRRHRHPQRRRRDRALRLVSESGGGEAGYIAPYPPDPNIVYAADYEGLITRYDKRTGQLQEYHQPDPI